MSGVTLYPEPAALAAVPPGAATMYAGAAAPAGWLLCDGTAVSRTAYANLFNAIGTAYGTGDGSTTFNVPDLRGRVPLGVGTGTGLTNRVRAATGGAQDAVVASHSHSHAHTASSGTVSADHTHSGTTAGEAQLHSHGINVQWDVSQIGGAGAQVRVRDVGGANGQAGQAAGTGNGGTQSALHSHTFSTGGISANHTHAITVDASAVAAGVSPTDANMPPWLGINFIIKT